MFKKIVIGMNAVVMIALGVIAVLTNSEVFAQQLPRIVMNLSGSEEVPPVQTKATGVAEFTPGEDSSI
jgi:hypothetical protein